MGASDRMCADCFELLAPTPPLCMLVYFPPFLAVMSCWAVTRSGSREAAGR